MMHWHIDTDLISLAVLVVIYYYTRKVIAREGKAVRNRRFMLCLRAGMLMTVIDIFASVSMDVVVPPFVYHLFMILYLAVVGLTIVGWFFYALSIVFYDNSKAQKIWTVGVAVPYFLYVIFVALNPITGLMYTGMGETYQRGICFLPILLGVYAAYALTLFILVLTRLKHIPDGYPKSIMIICPVILTASIPIQLLNEYWLVILPAYMVCLLLAFLFSQNVRIHNEHEQISRLNDTIGHFSSGLSVLTINDGVIYLEYLSDGYCEIFGDSRESLTAHIKNDLLYGIHPDDIEAIERIMLMLRTSPSDCEVSYRFITEAGATKWINLKAKIVRINDKTTTCYCTYTDMTDQMLLRMRFYDVIQTIHCGICLYRWDGNELSSILANNVFFNLLGEKVTDNPNDVAKLTFAHAHPDDLQGLRDAVHSAIHGSDVLDITYRSKNFASDKYLWMRVRGTKIRQPDGVYLVYVSYNDVTQERDAQESLLTKYQLEKNRRSSDNGNLLASAVFDLTESTTLEYIYSDGSHVPENDRTAFSNNFQNASLLIDDEERARFSELNDKNTLIMKFAMGDTEITNEYRRMLPNGEVHWVRNMMRLVRDPHNGNILLFDYWYDIEEERMLKQTYQSLASDNYDYVARINCKTGKYTLFPRAGLTYCMPPVNGDNADEAAREMYSSGIVEEDKETALQNSLIENIVKNLNVQERIRFTYREQQPDGSIHFKRINQYYLDRQRGIVIVTREDVTDIIRAESEKNAILAAALDAANAASEAKSQFLSRVSHELRTPLNAIIGFMELAKDADKEQIQNYLQNSNAAALQLLSIINDVLDMSAIESGKMRISSAPFDFKQLIGAIANIYIPQCYRKGLKFDTLLATPVDEWLVGDKLRLNQILFNLINNAIKFTAQGYVKLTVSQTDCGDGRVFVRFDVSDTGCGMSEEMKNRLFMPFEQESAATAQKYGGSGLGLSIVSNLVTMMGGAVRAESEQGKGTTFTVELPFVKSENPNASFCISESSALHLLAVDDEAVERNYISVVLNRIGVRFSCVENGNDAMRELERAEKANDRYNICLVDWKMPVMDGIETTRRIREKYGNNVIVIVVSAYEHHQADESAKQAGADMFVTKPLFQSSLYDLIITLTGNKLTLKKTQTQAKSSFSGKRVLIAEDNILNRMVVEGLVKRMGILCEAAEDGKTTADMFISSPKGYYDAILMDIQMPIMNGYEATRVIRQSNHPDAQNIKIIALTANAFKEDVARSLSNGMNDHLAKPIEPALLSEALKKAFEGE